MKYLLMRKKIVDKYGNSKWFFINDFNSLEEATKEKEEYERKTIDIKGHKHYEYMIVEDEMKEI
jgi:hypothetical protein